MSAEWIRDRLEQAARNGEVIKLTGSRSLTSPGHAGISDYEFHKLETALEEAKTNVAAARAAESAAWEALHAAQCWEEFGPAPRGGMWRCTLKRDHDGEHSNIFSRGEAKPTRNL